MTTLNRKSSRALLILSIVFASYTLLISTCFGLEIKIRDRVESDKETITLGDIATFTPADDLRVKHLKKIEISAAPAPDTFRRLNKELIAYKITPSLNGDKDVTLDAPDNMSVYRSAQFVDEETINDIFKDFVLSNSPWDYDKTVIENINSPSPIALPKGRLDWDVQARHNNNFLGNVSIQVDFKVDENSVRKIIVSGKVSVIRDILKAARNINSGDIISSDDLMMVSEKSRFFKKNLLTDKRGVVGKRATRRIQANQPVKLGMFEVPPMIDKGDRVIIRAESSDLLITAVGKALEEGGLGEQIRVLNINSKREIIATVKRPDIVEVTF